MMRKNTTTLKRELLQVQNQIDTLENVAMFQSVKELRGYTIRAIQTAPKK
jgi:hypothetical protein